MTVGKHSHQFHIHTLGIQGAYSFPVSVPIDPFSSSSSVCAVASGSSIDGNTWYLTLQTVTYLSCFSFLSY